MELCVCFSYKRMTRKLLLHKFSSCLYDISVSIDVYHMEGTFHIYGHILELGQCIIFSVFQSKTQ